jgi:hypothetical protein
MSAHSCHCVHLLCRLVHQRRELVVLMLQLNQRLLCLHCSLHFTCQQQTVCASCLEAEVALSLQFCSKGHVLGEADKWVLDALQQTLCGENW